MDQLALETAEEIFYHGVVAGIALAGHALPNSIGLKALPEGPRGVLDAPVTVKMSPLGGLQRRTARWRASSVRDVSMRSEKA